MHAKSNYLIENCVTFLPPKIAKLFLPSVRCPICGHANDFDFLFCQRCGYKRRVLTARPKVLLDVNVSDIDDRLRQLALFEQATSYAKQKESLQRTF